MNPFVDEKECRVLTSVQLLGDGAFHYGNDTFLEGTSTEPYKTPVRAGRSVGPQQPAPASAATARDGGGCGRAFGKFVTAFSANDDPSLRCRTASAAAA